MKTEMEIGILLLQAKQNLEPQEAKKGSPHTHWPPAEPPEDVWPCQHLDFRLLARNYERTHSCCFKSSSLLCQLWETNTNLADSRSPVPSPTSMLPEHQEKKNLSDS